jgi:hypothetical protein
MNTSAGSSFTEPSSARDSIQQVVDPSGSSSTLALNSSDRTQSASPDLPREFLRLSIRKDMDGLDARAAVLQPFDTDYLPNPEPNEPLFLPADAQRHWYLGYLHHWKDFQKDAIQHWNRPECKKAFDELDNWQVDETRPSDLRTTEDGQGPARLEYHFRRQVLETVEKIYNTLLTTTAMKLACGDEVPQGMWLESAADNEELAAKDVKPAFLVRGQSARGRLETRLVGHIEYLGGRPGALTLAIKEAARNTWGSLRCVLGKSPHVLDKQTTG